MSKIINFVAVALARFYNWIPKRLRIIIFNATSAFLSTFGTVIVGRAAEFKTEDPIVIGLIAMFILIFSGVINEIQDALKAQGDLLLAKQGNETVLQQNVAKAKKATKLVSIATKAQA